MPLRSSGRKQRGRGKVLLKGEAGCGAGKAQPFPVFEEKNSGTSFLFFRRICQEGSTDLCRLEGNEPEGISNQRGNVRTVKFTV